MKKKKIDRRGGRREGAGRKKTIVDERLRKRPVSFSLTRYEEIIMRDVLADLRSTPYYMQCAISEVKSKYPGKYPELEPSAGETPATPHTADTPPTAAPRYEAAGNWSKPPSCAS